MWCSRWIAVWTTTGARRFCPIRTGSPWSSRRSKARTWRSSPEASCPAKKLGLRLHDHAKAWLEKYPYDQRLWSCLEDVDDAVVLAERLLPLDELQTSLASGNAAGVAHPAKGAFESVVRKVARHPGHGWPLLRMALASHVSVVSRTAVYALSRGHGISSQPTHRKCSGKRLRLNRTAKSAKR
jgi:hypothetical protein